MVVHIGVEIIAESVPRRVKFKGSYKNICKIISKNFEEILKIEEIVMKFCRQNILKFCGKSESNVLYNN